MSKYSPSLNDSLRILTDPSSDCSTFGIVRTYWKLCGDFVVDGAKVDSFRDSLGFFGILWDSLQVEKLSAVEWVMWRMSLCVRQPTIITKICEKWVWQRERIGVNVVRQRSTAQRSVSQLSLVLQRFSPHRSHIQLASASSSVSQSLISGRKTSSSAVSSK